MIINSFIIFDLCRNLWIREHGMDFAHEFTKIVGEYLENLEDVAED